MAGGLSRKDVVTIPSGYNPGAPMTQERAAPVPFFGIDRQRCDPPRRFEVADEERRVESKIDILGRVGRARSFLVRSGARERGDCAPVGEEPLGGNATRAGVGRALNGVAQLEHVGERAHLVPG